MTQIRERPVPVTGLEVDEIRRDFPALDQEVNGHPLVYLDNAASSQKPLKVIQAMDHYYRFDHSNVHRGIHELSRRATDAYEDARSRIARFFGVSDPRELIFTSGTTEAINLVARSWGDANIREGDLIILSYLEHHSNIVPWQMLAARTGAIIRYIEVDDEGRLRMDHLDELLSGPVRLVAIGQMSNALGTVNPVAEIAERAHAAGAKVLVDGAQSAPHMPVDVAALDCDFFAFSGHKMCGPTGIGGLWARREILEEMPPFLGGGDMIHEVRLEASTWAKLPSKFEAGTPKIAEVIGLGAAVDYLSSTGMEAIHAHEEEVCAYALERLQAVPDLAILGPREARDRGAVISFTLADVHPHDLATILDGQGLAIRAGHHCTQPLMKRLGVSATARASFYLYNTVEEVDRLVDGLVTARSLFGYS